MLLVLTCSILILVPKIQFLMSGFLKACWCIAETVSDVYCFVGEKGADKILQKMLHFLTSNST